MDSFPLFIVGAPRSGTTFLCSVLNAHPLIQLTNECRVFALLKQMLDADSHRPDLLGQTRRESLDVYARRTLGAWIEGYYREALGVRAPIWGDKHPPYADPTLLSGRIGAIEREPRSGSCLRLIRELLPNARFIHIHRDPVGVANSLVRKHWIGSINDGVRVWGQYVNEILEFFTEVPASHTLTIGYRGLIGDAETTTRRIGDFLGLDDASPIGDFLDAQRRTPTPFSDPVTDIADLYVVRPVPAIDNSALLTLAEQAATRLGYSAA